MKDWKKMQDREGNEVEVEPFTSENTNDIIITKGGAGMSFHNPKPIEELPQTRGKSYTNIVHPQNPKPDFSKGTRQQRRKAERNEAKNNGITYEEAKKSFEPTEEEKLKEEQKERSHMEKDDKRLQLLKDTYWNAEASLDLDCIDTSLVSFSEIKNPTQEQIRVIFNMLPQEIFGLGVQWGFRDTEVGESIHEYIEENIESILKNIEDKNHQLLRH